jgi:cell division protein FtsQ
VAVQSPATRAKKPEVLRPDREARIQLRRAARERRRYERGEVRRFTRRSRNRRIGILSVVGVVVLLTAMLLVAVYSPLLSLRTITVEGTSRVDPAAVQAAVADQIGKPLALVDFDEITRELGTFPLIRSYVTETVPPDSIVIRIDEREPIAVRESGSTWQLIDPAGIVVDTLKEVPDGFPIIRATPGTAAFDSAVAVLLALPEKLLAKVHAVSATTNDDVTLELASGQHVIWGNAERTDLKATALTAIMKKQKQIKQTDVDYNLSAPMTPLVIEK